MRPDRAGMALDESGRLRAAWICLLVIGAGIFIFGLVAVTAPGSSDPQLMRAGGLAAIDFGLFGMLIPLWPFRHREPWAWCYPVFWLAHLLGHLPPGKDHVHQVLFIVLSLAGLLLPERQFFSLRASLS